jgi:adenine-specific DNA-methyltransferase
VGAQPATLFDDIQPVAAPMPTTRYQGSKRKLLDWLWSIVQTLDFDTVLDAFSGTASVGYMLKSQGKRVTCNDLLHSNHQVAVALVENDRSPLPDHVADRLLTAAPSDRRTFIADTFRDIYFTDDENAWLDRLRHNIVGMEDRFHRATAWYALFQAAIAKRPYNLFHRRNLYMRTADVTRSFGNKRTWDKPFDEHWRHFVRRANAALIDTNKSCTCVCGDAADAAGRLRAVLPFSGGNPRLRRLVGADRLEIQAPPPRSPADPLDRPAADSRRIRAPLRALCHGDHRRVLSQ